MSSSIPQSNGLTFKQWFEWAIDALPVEQITGAITDDNWREYAGKLMQDPYMLKVNVIDYNNIAQWQDWADALVFAVENV